MGEQPASGRWGLGEAKSSGTFGSGVLGQSQTGTHSRLCLFLQPFTSKGDIVLEQKRPMIKVPRTCSPRCRSCCLSGDFPSLSQHPDPCTGPTPVTPISLHSRHKGARQPAKRIWSPHPTPSHPGPPPGWMPKRCSATRSGQARPGRPSHREQHYSVSHNGLGFCSSAW